MEDLHRRAEAVMSRVALTAIIGADVALKKAGQEQVGLCPFHHDANIGSFSVNDGKGIFKCFSCGVGGDHFKYLELRKGMTFMQALRMLEADTGIDFTDAKAKGEFDRLIQRREREQARDVEKRRLNARNHWLHAVRMMGTPAQWYLEGRGIDFAVLGRFPGAIRYRHDCWCTELERKIPAMVMAMTDLSGRHVATHRTYLEYVRGRWVKAALDQPKMTLGDYRGAHISFSKGDSGRVPLREVADGTTVAIGESGEDCLTVAMADPALRVLGSASLDNLGGVELPDQVGDVVLIAQHDAPGSAADLSFERQIARLQEAGKTVACMWPEPGFKDFNDQLRGVRMERVS